MSRDRVNLSDQASAEILVVEDALYPCPQCGKGGSPAPALPCEACGQAIHTTDIHCPRCQVRYPRDSVPVMVFVCRVCNEPGTSDVYIEEAAKRVHPECQNPTLN